MAKLTSNDPTMDKQLALNLAKLMASEVVNLRKRECVETFQRRFKQNEEKFKSLNLNHRIETQACKIASSKALNDES